MTGAGELDPAAAAEAAVSRPGDLWLLGRHRLLQADARNSASYERLMLPGERARLVLTDEPYNHSAVDLQIDLIEMPYVDGPLLARSFG